MAWVILIVAGLLEVVWAYAMKVSDGFTKLTPSILTLVFMVASFALLSYAMKTLPLGTAYTVWTGIGAIGSFLVGILILGDCAFPDGEAYIIDAGNAGMAKGGSGDVLAGLIGALCCQLPLKRAVVTACWVHAYAGDLCSEKFGEYAMLPMDLLDTIPEAMKRITADRNEG